MCEIQQQMHVDINKDELIRALQYDRNQYEKGYHDGVHDALAEGNLLVDLMSEYIKEKGIKSLMELVLKAIDEET